MDANLFGTKKSGGSSGYTPSAVSAAKPSSPIRTPDTGKTESFSHRKARVQLMVFNHAK